MPAPVAYVIESSGDWAIGNSFHRQRPYQYGSSIFVALANVWERTIGMFRSDDGGETWSHVAAGGDLVCDPDFSVGGDSCSDGESTIYLAFWDEFKVLSIASFDMATSTWGATIGGGPWEFDGAFGISMARRSDGSFVVTYTGGFDNWAHYAVLSGGSWSAGARWTSSSSPSHGQDGIDGGIVTGVDDNVHLFCRTSGSPHLYRHRSLSSGGGLGTEQTMTTASAFSIASNPVVTSDGRVFQANNAHFNLSWATSEWNPPSWSALALPVSRIDATQNIPALVAIDRKVYTLFHADGWHDRIHYAVYNTAGEIWTSVFEWYDAEGAYDFLRFTAARLTSTAIGVVAFDQNEFKPYFLRLAIGTAAGAVSRYYGI